MKKFAAILLAFCLLAAVPALAADHADVFTNFDKRDSWAEAVTVTFSEAGVLVNGGGVSSEGGTAYIHQAGTYILSGSCANGQIVVEVGKDDKVQLVLAGLTLTCPDSAPLYVISADKVSITLAPGSANSLTDGESYTRPFDKAPNACVYSRDDLTINGTGALTVTAHYNNGIGCKNDLHITGGALTVTAPKNALKGNGSVAILNGTITLNAGKDGIKADNEENDAKGYVYIAGGAIDITAGDDAIQAVQDVTITGGSILVSAGDKTVNSDGIQDVASGVITQK